MKVPQDKDKDDLFVKRNSTAECFQFMVEDLDHAITLLPEKIAGSSADYGACRSMFCEIMESENIVIEGFSAV